MASRIRLLFSKHPLAGNVVVYGVLYGGSEATQQTIRGEKQYDWAQIGRMALTGTVFAAMNFAWYRKLDTLVLGSCRKTVMKKVVADQLTMGAFGAFAFYAISSGFEGKPLKMCVQEGVEKWPRTYAVSCCFWPAIQVVNFTFLTTAMRAPYVASAAFVWSNFLCYLKAAKDDETEEGYAPLHSKTYEPYENIQIPATSLIPNVIAQTQRQS